MTTRGRDNMSHSQQSDQIFTVKVATFVGGFFFVTFNVIKIICNPCRLQSAPCWPTTGLEHNVGKKITLGLFLTTSDSAGLLQTRPNRSVIWSGTAEQRSSRAVTCRSGANQDSAALFQPFRFVWNGQTLSK